MRLNNEMRNDRQQGSAEVTMFAFAKSVFQPQPVARAKAVCEEAKPPDDRDRRSHSRRGGGKTWDRHVKVRVSTEQWDKVNRNGGSAWLRELIDAAPEKSAA